MSPDLDSQLTDLQGYAKGQNTRIKTLDIPHFLPPSGNPFWNTLWESVWRGQTADISDRGYYVTRSSTPDAADDSIFFPDGAPTSCRAMNNPQVVQDCWKLNCDKILIRSEFDKAEEFLLLQCRDPYIHAVILTGQPGIGVFFSYPNPTGP